MSPAEAFGELVRIMARLRAPGGCPWDREQTHDSIKPYLVEETYEVVEAIDNRDDRELATELGDLLLQIVFHAQMASEDGRFTIVDVVRAINEKLVRRHPHVFSDLQVDSTAEVLRNWSKIKAAERDGSDDRSALAGVPRGMPALLRAQRLGEKAAHVGFDWERAEDVLAKVSEELDELRRAIDSGDASTIGAEIGDLLLATTSIARHLDVNAEDALTQAADRFDQRFRHMEDQLAAQGRSLDEMSASEKDELWEAAKKALHHRDTETRRRQI